MLVNFYVDPGNIYYREMKIRQKEVDLVATFKRSDMGIYYNGNERFLKTVLAKNSSSVDCFAIGSSRIMQFSSIRSLNIRKQCKHLLNLAVSGASFEDIFIFLDIIQNLKLDSHPKIIIGIDPWTLKFSMDVRYLTYKGHFDNFILQNGLSSTKRAGEQNQYNKILNLINLEYTSLSIKRIFASKESPRQEDALYSSVVSKSDPNHFKDAITLPDGSHLYSAEYIENNTTSEEYRQSPDYKLNGEVVDPAAVSLFFEAIEVLKNDYKIILLLTPYHHSAFSTENLKYQKYFNQVEETVRSFGQKLNIKILGSFNPKSVGCQADEFYDFMHPKSSCINRIFEENE